MRGIKSVLLALVAVAGLLLGGCGSDNETVLLPSDGVGIVAFQYGWIGVINTGTKTVSTPVLAGDLGSAGGSLLDVAITPNRTTALVSNFGDDTVFFIDLRTLTPRVLGSVTLSFFPEDISLTPDGRYAVVSDGGLSPNLAVIDVRNRALVEEYTDAGGNAYQAVAVAADGQTVLTVDYANGAVNVLTLSDVGHLTYVGNIDVSNGGSFFPVNVSISPDGQTAIVAGVATATAPELPADYMNFPVLQITAPGVVTLIGNVTPTYRINASQSIVFNPQGTKAYAYCVQENSLHNTIVEMNVTGPGEVVDAGITMDVQFAATGQLFGVDTIAMSRSGRNLYVSNMSTFNVMSHMEVLDLKTRESVKVIEFPDVEMPPGGGTFETAIPTGVFIR